MCVCSYDNLVWGTSSSSLQNSVAGFNRGDGITGINLPGSFSASNVLLACFSDVSPGTTDGCWTFRVDQTAITPLSLAVCALMDWMLKRCDYGELSFRPFFVLQLSLPASAISTIVLQPSTMYTFSLVPYVDFYLNSATSANAPAGYYAAATYTWVNTESGYDFCILRTSNIVSVDSHKST